MTVKNSKTHCVEDPGLLSEQYLASEIESTRPMAGVLLRGYFLWSSSAKAQTVQTSDETKGCYVEQISRSSPE